MKDFQRVILVIFSFIGVALAVCILFASTNIMNMPDMVLKANNYLVNHKSVGIVIGAIMAILGLIGIFATTDSQEEKKGGIAIKSESGTVYITKDTFENIVLGVTKKYVELKNVKVDVLMSEEGLEANIYTSILPDTVVPTLTAKVQENVKSSVLKQTTVEMKDVNVKIRGVYQDAPKK